MVEKPEPVRHCRPGIRARQSQHVGPPPGVIGHLVGPPQSSWPTISYCISSVRIEAKVIWLIKKRLEPCAPSGWRESARLEAAHRVRGATSAHPEPEALGVRGVWWKDLGKSQGRRGTRTVQIAGQKMCLHGRGIFKSITRCCKTKPPTTLLVGRGHSDNSRKQAWKQQSSQASSPRFYRPGSRHTHFCWCACCL